MDYTHFTKKIRFVGNRLIEDYIQSGHVKTGVNGPYDDPETEVRNLAHLLVIASVECIKYKRPELKDVIKKITFQLFAMRNADGIYKMRQKENKDQCNGVIGHAWLVEGFLFAYYCIEDEQLLNEAERILLMHKFQPKLGLWGRPLIGNTNSAIDFTFNHQLWFAATVAEFLQVRKNLQLEKELNQFFDKIQCNMQTNSKGRILHSVYLRMGMYLSFKMFIKRLRTSFYEILEMPSLKYKEIGYHVFNLMALARLYYVDKKRPFFKTTKFIAVIEYIKDKNYQKWLSASNIQKDASSYSNDLTDIEKSINIYGYPYNVPGYELVFCKEVFGEIIDTNTVNFILDEQFNIIWDEERNELNSKCHDKTTVNYRAYEYYRYLYLINE